MDVNAADLAAQVVPYVTAAGQADGGHALENVRDAAGEGAAAAAGGALDRRGQQRGDRQHRGPCAVSESAAGGAARAGAGADAGRVGIPAEAAGGPVRRP